MDRSYFVEIVAGFFGIEAGRISISPSDHGQVCTPFVCRPFYIFLLFVAYYLSWLRLNSDHRPLSAIFSLYPRSSSMLGSLNPQASPVEIIISDLRVTPNIATENPGSMSLHFYGPFMESKVITSLQWCVCVLQSIFSFAPFVLKFAAMLERIYSLHHHCHHDWCCLFTRS